MKSKNADTVSIGYRDTVWIHLSESGTGGGKDYIKLNLRRRNVKVTIK
nr:MAG TPA_asm: hypothetical protein [Caudoviricetes sp.]